MSDQLRGATPAEWGHLDWVLGLGANLLPCVPAAPDVVCAPKSALEGKVGKIPSAFNREGLAHGIKDWQKREILGNEITLWANDGRYNVCVRTGPISGVYAIDVDIDDPMAASAVLEELKRLWPSQTDFHLRTRPNSGKFLLMFRLIE